MNGKKLYYILRSVWVVVILLVMLVLMNRDFTDISAKNKQNEENTRLNIALVNEDTGVTKDEVGYNLGADYVKKIEKDATYNWFTVSRGIAENGLKNGTYNLLVTIPSNFSSKLLEIDNEDPEQLQINYKINANGNATLENESNSVGKKIINDLNQQLVDLYVASIIDNLYTAQKNIEKVYTNQTESVGDFTNILYGPTVDFKSNFPSLAGYSSNALQSNDLLKSALGMTTDSAGSLVESNQDYSTTLEKLIAERAEGKITYEDFVQTLLSLDTTLSSEDTNALFQKVSDMNNYFQTQFSSTEDGEFFVQTAALNEQLETSKKEIEEQQTKLAAIKDSFYETYKEQFMASFGKTKDDTVVTLGDVLNLKDSLNTDSDSSSQFEQISTFNQNYIRNMQDRLNKLPYINSDDSQTLPAYFSYANAPYWSSNNTTIENSAANIATKVTQINQKIENANNSFSQQTTKIVPLTLPDADTQSESSYYNDLKGYYKTLTDLRTGIIRDQQSFMINWSKVGKATTIIIKKPSSVSADNFYVNNQLVTFTGDTAQVDITSAGNKKITYYFSENYDETTPDNDNEFDITLKQPYTYMDGNTVKTQYDYTVKWNEPVNTSAFLKTDYQTAKKNYSEELGRIYELYDTVNTELDNFDQYPFAIFHTFLDTPLTDVFKSVLENVFLNGEYEKQLNHLTLLMETANQIEAEKKSIDQTLATIYENSNTLNDGVTGQLTLLSQLITNSSDATQKNTLVTADNNSTDSQIDSMSMTLKMILQQSEMLKKSSETNVSQAESVQATFDAFDKQVNATKQKSESLSTSADNIKKELDDELKTNDNFVSAFVKVLNNAYEDGVPNNTLLSFIANPIGENAETTIKTAEITGPFTWILIMFTLSLFIAYLFATQPVVKKLKDRFKRENLWIQDNGLETALLSISAVGVGLILGILSISELGIKKEAQIVWVFIIILFMLIFSLINHYGLKQFHIAGFAVSLFLFISYVFVTNAIGKTNSNNPIVGAIRFINPLSIGETNLADILANEALNVVNIILYLFVIVALVVINLFIWKPRRKGKDVVKI